MPRILVEIDTAKLLNHTSSLQDREIFAEMLSAMDDDDIVNEVVKRELLDDVFLLVLRPRETINHRTLGRGL